MAVRTLAERLDSGYSKAVEKVMGKNADTHMSVASEDYIQAVLTSYKHNQQEVISAYEQEYGNRESGINEVAFLIACAERDWSENHKSFEFVFPELGVINVAKTFVELPSDNKGQSISME
jgi:tRNA U34 5-methylaminomethyl-2-thiouridine-forming methyltransferase MnmC